MYYNARYYDPSLGRFLTPDTIVPDLANAQSFNRYVYTYNNPVKYVDPTGHFVEEIGPGNHITDESLDRDIEHKMRTGLGFDEDNRLDRINPTRKINTTSDLHFYANSLKKIIELTNVQKLARAADMAKKLTKGDIEKAINDLVDVFAGGIPGLRQESKYYIGYSSFWGPSGFKPQYAQDSNQVRHFIGSLFAGYKGGNVFGTAMVYGNEILHNQPLSGPDIELGIAGVEMGAQIEKINNWGEYINEYIGQ